MSKVAAWGLSLAVVSNTNTAPGRELDALDEDGPEASPDTERAVWTREIKLVAPPLPEGQVWVIELDRNGNLRSSTVTLTVPSLGVEPSTGNVTAALEIANGSWVLRSGIDSAPAGAALQFVPWRLLLLTRRPRVAPTHDADGKETSRESPMAKPRTWRRPSGRPSA